MAIFSDVTLDAHAVDALLPEAVESLVQAFLVPTADHYLTAFQSQALGDGQTDSARKKVLK